MCVGLMFVTSLLAFDVYRSVQEILGCEGE